MRVLVVEDEPHIAAAVERGLRAEGFGVDTAEDGEKGLLLARRNEYAVIVLDLMLPGRNGYDVCRTLRASDVMTPVLILTAKDGEYDEADALDLGADDYLTKPFSFVVLLARIRALLRRGAPQRPAVLTAGDLWLDPGAHRCGRGESLLELTPREFALLEYLLRHPDTVVSKTELLAEVWDAWFEGDPNIVEVYVGYLRRKIDTPFGRAAIETVRGVGYRLDGKGG
ncbi:response regulator transcription factor [Streptomyces scopuliridis]|uniref:Transcriptional regulator n=2 Tax=Streptomyces scopuliridis TaxID=452529 RepID=A0A2T7STL8_9ACTN|nr:response regulator transcription factor [Streptomyces scopuliridis]PVE06192.1 transcriptional regulator [Streptomyces scopuliridis RB72]WSB38910.1 response regulator transcription factor [Streptomyces scopuliridis]WSC03351.1 response regulator transcription factor [Streptomyces scopuliridis]WSC10773.1 response regulator transcription factor [Streptomyces scopuliridis]